MASLNVFAQRMRQLGERVEKNVDKTIIRTALAVDQAVVLGTPVDTGHARGNWQVGIGASVKDVIERLDPTGSATIDENNAKIQTREKGQDIFISNNVNYINTLNDGSSAQAPAGFVEEAVQAGVRAVKNFKVVR